jgi:hypothetical protein
MAAVSIYRSCVLIFCTFCLITACATVPQWYQEGKSEEETSRDYAQCRKQVTEKHGTDLESPHFKADLDQCMEIRGYHKKTP